MHERRPVVVFAGGGTGGHLYPALTLADALVVQRPDVDPRFVGALGGIESRILPERGLPHLLVRVEGLHRGRRLANVPVVLGLAGAVARVVSVYRRWKPHLVVGTGGYAAAPAGLAAALLRIPLALQEQNSLPGVTTKLLSRFADQIHLGYPEAREHLPDSVWHAVRLTGNPIRPLDRVSRSEGRRRFGLAGSSVVVLVTGGSQGSKALNDRLLEALAAVADGSLAVPATLEVLWMTGLASHPRVLERLDALGGFPWVHALPYIDDMPAALSAADLALGRAGAMSTAEFVASGLPSVLIPLPSSAEDHQTKNALALQDAGVAVCLRQAETTGTDLWRALVSLAEDSELRAAMSARARERAQPGAARRIAGDLALLLPPDRGIRSAKAGPE